MGNTLLDKNWCRVKKKVSQKSYYMKALKLQLECSNRKLNYIHFGCGLKTLQPNASENTIGLVTTWLQKKSKMQRNSNMSETSCQITAFYVQKVKKKVNITPSRRTPPHPPRSCNKNSRKKMYCLNIIPSWDIK